MPTRTRRARRGARNPATAAAATAIAPDPAAAAADCDLILDDRETATPPEAATPPAARPAKPRPTTKLGLIITALRSEAGATVPQLAELTGWKINSVRGVLAGTLKTRHGLVITSTRADGVRTYRATVAE